VSQSTRLTDGETDRILIASPRLHSMQRGKINVAECDNNEIYCHKSIGIGIGIGNTILHSVVIGTDNSFNEFR